MADRIGQQLGNYRLIRLLGQGGFAEVYLGEHVYLETQAAIKVLLTQLAREDIEAFRIEARTIARLDHPHIVRVLDFGVEGGTPFLAMSYAPGGTVRQHHPRGTRLSLPLVVSYVKQVASALQYAHEEKLIHRDVKPENILLGRHGEVLLSDFGIALVAQTSRHQLTEASTGTPPYMAPEQIQGKPRRASDQYALGVVVYEWLSGTVPFTGSALEVFGQHLHMSPTPLQEKVSGIPIAVEQVVMHTLAKDPKARFATMQAFATALEQASQVEGVDETAPGRRTRSLGTERTVLSQEQQPEFVAQRSESFLPTTFSLPTSTHSGPVVPGSSLSDQQIEPLPSPVASSSTVLVGGNPPLPLSPETQPPVDTATIPLAPSNRRRSPTLVVSLLLLVLILVAGGSLGIWEINATALANRNATALANRNATATALVNITGRTWYAQNAGTSPYLAGVAWSGSQFVVVGDSDTILTSPDGHTWTVQNSGTLQDTSPYLAGVAWSGSQFVVVGDSGTILTSHGGHAWTAQNSDASYASSNLAGVAWSGSQFVVVGDSGTILTSPDGHTWTVQNSGTLQDLHSVVWSGSQFVAVGWHGTILTSLDGHTWTVQNSDASSNLDGVAWSGSQFVAVGWNDTIFTSPDGHTWTVQNSGTSYALPHLDGVAWSGSQFVAVGWYGTILTSLDGHTWTVQNSGTLQDLHSVAWSGSQFVAVGDSGTILTSP